MPAITLGTVWDTDTAAVAVHVIASHLEPLDPEDPEGGYQPVVDASRTLHTVGRERRDNDWLQPIRLTALADRLAPRAAGVMRYLPSWVLLERLDAPPSGIPNGKKLGTPRATPVVDLVAGTAVWYTLVDKSVGDIAADLAAAKAAKIAAIKAKALGPDGIVAQGFVYSIPGSPQDPHTYQIGLNDQGNMTSIGGLFALGAVDAHGGFWRDASNVNVTMTQAECTAFFEAAAAYKSAIVRRMWALITAVGDAADTDALALINVAAGSIDGSGAWPANG